MEQFVKFRDSEGTEIFLTRKEVEQVNKRLEFSHTIKVFGKHTSRPLYIMPKEFERGIRRFKHYAGDKEMLLDITKLTRWQAKLRNLRSRSDLLLFIFLAGSIFVLWHVGGGTPIANVIRDSDGGIGKYVIPAAAVLLFLALQLFVLMRKRSASFEVHEE